MHIQDCLEEILHLEDTDLAASLADASRLFSCKKRQLVAKPDACSDWIPFLVSGVIRGYLTDEKGRDITDCFLYRPGEAVLSLSILTASFPINSEAVTDCVLLSIPTQLLAEQFQQSAELQQLYSSYLLEKLKLERELKLLLGISFQLSFFSKRSLGCTNRIDTIVQILITWFGDQVCRIRIIGKRIDTTLSLLSTLLLVLRQVNFCKRFDIARICIVVCRLCIVEGFFSLIDCSDSISIILAWIESAQYCSISSVGWRNLIIVDFGLLFVKLANSRKLLIFLILKSATSTFSSFHRFESRFTLIGCSFLALLRCFKSSLRIGCILEQFWSICEACFRIF